MTGIDVGIPADGRLGLGGLAMDGSGADAGTPSASADAATPQPATTSIATRQNTAVAGGRGACA